MSDKIFFSINGINDVVKELKTMSDDVNKRVIEEVYSSALNIQSNAKKAAPVNMGTLRNSIQLKENINKGTLIYEVGSKLSYAPYMEFGTGPMVKVPSGYDEFAMQFKGKGTGTFYDFLLAIAEWVRRKGIKGGIYNIATRKRQGSKAKKFDEDVLVAERIAYAILKKGIRPQPYLIPSYELEIPKLKKKINEITQNVKS